MRCQGDGHLLFLGPTISVEDKDRGQCHPPHSKGNWAQRSVRPGQPSSWGSQPSSCGTQPPPRGPSPPPGGPSSPPGGPSPPCRWMLTLRAPKEAREWRGSGCMRAPQTLRWQQFGCNKAGKGISGKEETKKGWSWAGVGWGTLCLVARTAPLAQPPRAPCKSQHDLKTHPRAENLERRERKEN